MALRLGFQHQGLHVFRPKFDGLSQVNFDSANIPEHSVSVPSSEIKKEE